MGPAFENKNITVREITTCQNHGPCCIHLVVPDVIIGHVQSHSAYNKDDAKYGNVIQAHIGIVVEH